MSAYSYAKSNRTLRLKAHLICVTRTIPHFSLIPISRP